jgi:aminoglycoside/choline kinase family phosphotransferase
MRREQEPHFDVDAFSRAYTILAAQRATKVLGVFSRLVHRDGKARYAAHIPRVQTYLARTLRSPIFDDLFPWYKAHLPTLFTPS